MKRKIKIIFAASVMVIALAGCSWWDNFDNETANEVLSVVYKSPEANFNDYQTFMITDSVLYVNEERNTRVSNTFTERLIENVTENFEACGYTKVTDRQPDLIIDLSFIVSTFSSVYVDPFYYWGWDWWWDYMWWDGYPFYPYYPYAIPTYYSSYSAYNIIIEAVDMTNADNAEKVPVVWHAVVRSLVNGENASEQEIREAVHECFEMMPPKNN